MKKHIFILATITHVITALFAVPYPNQLPNGNGIAIPIVWQRPENRVESGLFRGIGVVQDNKYLIIAFHEWNNDNQDLLSIYWNSDNDKNSGRFAKSFGADWQFNLNPAKKTLAVLRWENDKAKTALVIKDTDYHIYIENNMLILAIAKSLLKTDTLKKNSVFRVNRNSHTKRLDSVYFEFNPEIKYSQYLFNTVNLLFGNDMIFPSAPPAGEGMDLPVTWQRSKKQISTGKFQAIGINQNEERLIFGFANWPADCKDMVSIYWNCDGNKNSGRFPKSYGTDLQFNINPIEKSIRAVIWNNDKERRIMTLYEDDYLIETKNNILFVGIRKEALNQVKISPQSSFWINRSTNTTRLDSVEFDYDSTKKTDCYLPLRWYFLRFGNTQNNRTKKVAAQYLQNSFSGVKIWSCESERFMPGEPSPAITATTSCFDLKAAAGETEHLFFAIDSSEPIKELTVSMDDKKLFPLSDCTIRYADYVEDDRGDSYTDVLLPKFPGRPVVRQFMVFSCTVPRYTPKGIYKAGLNVKINGKKAVDIPISMEVYGFQLPERSTFKTAFSIKGSHISAKFKDKTTIDNIYKKMLNQSIRHRYSPRLVGNEPKFKFQNGELLIDWNNYENSLKEYFQYFNPAQLTPAQLGSHDNFYRWNGLLNKKYSSVDNPEFLQVWQQFVKQYYARFKANGLLDKMLFIIWDEPYTRWNDINLASSIVHANAPGVPVGVFIDKFEPLIDKQIDIWLVPFTCIAEMRTNPKHQKKRVWLYNSGGVSNFRLPAADLRGYYLLAHRYNIEGFLSSEINMIANCGTKNNRFYNHYPQHCWMYVSDDGSEIFDSWRQLLIAEGLDDYDYLHIYHSLLKRKNKTIPKWLMEALPEFNTEGQINFKIDTIAQWNKLRDRIAREIAAMQSLNN